MGQKDALMGHIAHLWGPGVHLWFTEPTYGAQGFTYGAQGSLMGLPPRSPPPAHSGLCPPAAAAPRIGALPAPHCAPHTAAAAQRREGAQQLPVRGRLWGAEGFYGALWGTVGSLWGTVGCCGAQWGLYGA